MGGIWRRVAGYGPILGYALGAYGCGSETQTGKVSPGPAGAGAAPIGGAASTGGAIGASGAGSGGTAAGGASAGGAPSGGDAGPPAPSLGTCVPKSELPASCSEVCLDQGKRCSEDCDVGSFLPARAVYYRDAQSCEARTNPVFLESARCDARWESGNFLPWAVVSCCCESSPFKPATAGEREALCEAACKEDPYPMEPECEAYGGCTGDCVDWTRGVERACAACLISGARFTQTGCNSFECVCGGITLPDLWRACNDECAGTRQHERDLYAAKPRPEPVGRAPALSREIPAGFHVHELLADEPDRLWAVGTSSSADGSGSRLSVKLFDASLNVLWEWDDPAARQIQNLVLSTRLGGETVVTAQPLDASAFLLFFDGAGGVREVKSPIVAPSALSSLGDGLLLKNQPSVDILLTALDVTGAVRFEAPATTLDGFFAPWTHVVHTTPPSWTVVANVREVLQWRRVAPTGIPLEPAAVLWTRSLTQPSIVYGAAAAGDDVIAWGSRSAKRENVDGGFPWVTRLAADGTARFEWSNGDLVTPGKIKSAVHTALGDTCAVGDESWEYSRADVPASGPRCSPDGCEGFTVRCFDAAGAEKWKYHHRSESSVGHAIAATRTGQLFLTATVERDPLRSTGWRDLLYRFDP